MLIQTYPCFAQTLLMNKTQDTAVLEENCPWCAGRGQTHALRSYSINHRDFITLCSNPSCIYPLVSKPLEDVRASLASEKDLERCKRKRTFSSAADDLLPSPKLGRDEFSSPGGSCSADNMEPSGDTGQGEPFGDYEPANGHLAHEESGSTRNDFEEHGAVQPIGCVEEEEQQQHASSSKEMTEETHTDDDLMMPSTDLVDVNSHLFWKNENNLCWLDAILVALVQSKIIRSAIPKTKAMALSENLNYPIWNLCSSYDQTCEAVRIKEQVCKDSIVRVPSDVLLKAEKELSDLRMSAFKLVQPKLRNTLGQDESPVFALPLLLETDDWAQNLFQHAARWEFKCTACGHTLNSSCEKTVTTFTQVMQNWHPLKAVHRAQCSNCHRKNQRRKMVLERASPLFVAHFVEGLPRKEICSYSFDLQGMHYAIKTVIQYNQQRKHFATWIQQPDGSWLEFDDLKHPRCVTHRTLSVPAREMHMVFWEGEASEDCVQNKVGSDGACAEEASTVDVVPDHDSSLSMPQDDTYIVAALTEQVDQGAATVNYLDASIGSTTLLDTFEGLSHNDIVTLTLVEVKGDPEEQSSTHTQDIARDLSVVGDLKRPPAPKKSPASSVPGHPQPYGGRSCSETREVVLPTQVNNGPPLPSAVVLQLPPVPTLASPPLPATPVSTAKTSLSFLLSRHPSVHSTPCPLRQPPPAPQPKSARLNLEDNEALPAKPAELFGGFKAKRAGEPLRSNPQPSPRETKGLNDGGVKQPFVMPSIRQPSAISRQKSDNIAKSTTTFPSEPPEPHKKAVLKHSSAQPLNEVEALRLKLLKKLKSKKKKLAKLNDLLGKSNGEFAPRPDSTALCSPYTVSSSTSLCSSPTYDRFFADLLSPATTASNLSPDSTGLMEMIANGQSGDASDRGPSDNPALPPLVPDAVHVVPPPSNEDFLEEFMSGTCASQTAMEGTDFTSLDMFF